MGYGDWCNKTISLFTKFRELIKREKLLVGLAIGHVMEIPVMCVYV